MRIAVTGAAGQLGQAMALRLSERHEVTALARADLDVSRAADVLRVMAAIRPDAIVNCAAYNAVDRAEDDVLAALEGNAFGVQALARAAAREGAVLVHYSTDFVFDGNCRPAVPRGCPRLAAERLRPIEAAGRVAHARRAPALHPARREPLRRTAAAEQHRPHRGGDPRRTRDARFRGSGRVAGLRGGRRHRHGGVARAADRGGPVPLREQRSRHVGGGGARDCSRARRRSRGWYPCVSPMFRCGHAVPATAPCRTRSWRPPASRCPPGRTPFVAISPRTDGPAEGRDAIING